MKRKSSISLGPGASSLILIFVVLAMSALGMLSLMTSRNDLKLSERSVQVMESVYELNVRAEETRAMVDGILFQLSQKSQSQEEYNRALSQALGDGIEYSWTETDGVRTLDCALLIRPLGDDARCQWTRHNLTAETEEAW